MMYCTTVFTVLCAGIIATNAEHCKHFFYTNPTVNAPIDFVFPRDCQEWKDLGVNKSDIYPINPDDGEPFQVYCDMETDGGGWTVFQRRIDGSVDFYRYWSAYEEGFGNLNFEFWLGLSKIHRLTKARVATELYITVSDFEDNTAYAQYSFFSVGDSSSQYRLAIGGHSGTANDSMADCNGMYFTTRDSDNDRWSGNCATGSHGAWWYSSCRTDANLNGQYHDSAVTSNHSVSWYNWKSSFESLKFSEMKIRPTGPLPTTPPPPPPPDCKELKDDGFTTSGSYTINPDDGEPFQVYCDMETDGGGWTVFQRRLNGSVDFYRGWTDYQQGFGSVDGEFWLGLDNIHRLTAAGGTSSLRVDLTRFNGDTAYAQYTTFSIGDSSTEYTLSIGGYTGTAVDSLIYHNGMRFSSYDNDNDQCSLNCAHSSYRHGAWWYNCCNFSNLNGYYYASAVSNIKAVTWRNWTSQESLKATEMKLKRN